jgi:YbbR domain-containing protein
MEIVSDRPSSVDVTIRGTIGNTWFGQSVPTCRIDLQEAEEGPHTIPLTAENLAVPRASGLQVIAIRPARIHLVLERTISKEVPVRAVLGEPPKGIDVYGILISPSRILVTGPRTQVNRIREIPTEGISLAGQTDSFQAYAALDIKETSVHTTPPGPIEINVQLGPERRLVTISKIPVEVDDTSLTITPARISVGVLAPIATLSELTADNFIASVSVQTLDLTADTMKVKPYVRLREPGDPAIVIKNVPDVTVRRSGKAQTGQTRSRARSAARPARLFPG